MEEQVWKHKVTTEIIISGSTNHEALPNLSFGGLILDKTVSDPNFEGMAVFTPVINGEYMSMTNHTLSTDTFHIQSKAPFPLQLLIMIKLISSLSAFGTRFVDSGRRPDSTAKIKVSFQNRHNKS